MKIDLVGQIHDGQIIKRTRITIALTHKFQSTIFPLISSL